MSDVLETTELLPARMLNEFTYCPRLAYLEWVQGEWADSSDTLDGEYVHRNADRADQRTAATATTDTEMGLDAWNAEEKLHTRSLRLEDTELGLVAVVDIVEIEGRRATPVDYKKSAAPS